MARILLVDDDPNLLDVLSLALEDAGHDVTTAPDGVAGLRRVGEGAVDLVVTDVVMPGLDGLSLCRRVRAAGNLVPIVVLTSRDDEVDEALGLDLGADDYVAKPFSTRVLLARIAALLRREASRRDPGTPRPVATGDLAIDPERLEARWKGTPLVLTVTEFRVLDTLARRPGVVFTRERLLEHARGDDSIVAERIVDTYVKRLRRKLEALDADFDRIETVVGAGYRWRG